MAQQEQNEHFSYLPYGAAEVNRMIKENSDLFSDSQCKICSAVLISESQKLAHYQSKKHVSKVRRYMSIYGSGEPFVKRFKSSDTVSQSDVDERDKNKACHVCNMTFNSPVVAQSHYQGKIHSKNLRLKNCAQQTCASTPKGYPCTVCNIKLNSVEQYQEHIKGSKHKNHVKLKKPSENFQPDFQYTASQDTPEVSWCVGKLPQSPVTSSSPQPKAQVKKDDGSPEGEQGPVEQDPNRFCSKCKTSFNSPYMAQLHYQGKKHKKHLTKQNLTETCGSFSTPNLTETCGSASSKNIDRSHKQIPTTYLCQ